MVSSHASRYGELSNAPRFASALAGAGPLVETVRSFSPRQSSPGFLRLSKSSEKADDDRLGWLGGIGGGGGGAAAATGEKCRSMSWRGDDRSASVASGEPSWQQEGRLS